MFDFHPPQTTPPHYEYIIEKKDVSGQMIAKNRAFEVMNSLEGWCSKSKASILIDLIFMLRPKVVVEIGVWGGKSLIPMAIAVRENHGGKVYGIDPWEKQSSVEGMSGEHKDWWGKVDHKKIYRGLLRNIHSLGLKSHIELIQQESKDAPEIFNIDFLHIDGNHSKESSYLDVSKWAPLVSKGGIIIFDDIDWETTKSAVEFLDENYIKLAEFKGGNTWGIWLKN